MKECLDCYCFKLLSQIVVSLLLFFITSNWNTSGITTQTLSDGSILLKATHLTSFAVLVSLIYNKNVAN